MIAVNTAGEDMRRRLQRLSRIHEAAPIETAFASCVNLPPTCCSTPTLPSPAGHPLLQHLPSPNCPHPPALCPRALSAARPAAAHARAAFRKLPRTVTQVQIPTGSAVRPAKCG
eukprot:349624-Chlamydomonas_euryale.AAC.2